MNVLQMIFSIIILSVIMLVIIALVAIVALAWYARHKLDDFSMEEDVEIYELDLYEDERS